MANSSLGTNCLLTELLLGCEKQMKHILTYNPDFRIFISKVSCCPWTKARLIQAEWLRTGKVCAHTQKAPSSGKNAKGALTQQCAQCELLSVTLHLSPFSLYPRGYFASQEETGSSSMQMNCSEEEELPHLHRFTFTTLIHQWTEEMCMRKDESKGKSLLSTSCCLCCFC